jgi:hypothetical protein
MVVDEDAFSLCSRKGEVEGEELACFSDAEAMPREVESVQGGAPLGQSLRMGDLETHENREVQIDSSKDCQPCVSQKEEESLFDPLVCSQVAGREVGIDLRRV